MATAKKIVMAAAGVSGGPTLTQAFNGGVLAGGTSQSAYSQWSYTFTALFTLWLWCWRKTFFCYDRNERQ